MLKDRLAYWRRIFKVYGTKEKGYLSFWHERPAVSRDIDPAKLGPYYQTFKDKADYDGPKDEGGVILFDYYFDIGRQYNPLAVAQYGLGHWNLYRVASSEKRVANAEKHLGIAKTPAVAKAVAGTAGDHFAIAKIQGEWLVKNLETNAQGLKVWKHKFRWHYKAYLAPGWFSAHSQGTGIGLLARLYEETKDERYLAAARDAFVSLDTEIKDGGVKYVDPEGGVWLEEYLVEPPTHILNGYLWALWGVWDYFLLTGDLEARRLWNECITTLKKNMPRYDAGFWSMYDLSRQAMKMIASPFYHDLHIVQLHATALLSGEAAFEEYAKKFEAYRANPLERRFAFAYKALFKLLYF